MNEIIQRVSIVCFSADVEHVLNFFFVIVIVVFIRGSTIAVSGHYIAKQHKLDVIISVNLIYVKLGQKTAGVISP